MLCSFEIIICFIVHLLHLKSLIGLFIYLLKITDVAMCSHMDTGATTLSVTCDHMATMVDMLIVECSQIPMGITNFLEGVFFRIYSILLHLCTI